MSITYWQRYESYDSTRGRRMSQVQYVVDLCIIVSRGKRQNKGNLGLFLFLVDPVTDIDVIY